MDNESLSQRLKRPRRDTDELPPSGAEVKERVPLLSFWAFMAVSVVKYNCTFLLVSCGCETRSHTLMEELGVFEKCCGGKYLALKGAVTECLGKRRNKNIHDWRSN
jgi:hypothetical protein